MSKTNADLSYYLLLNTESFDKLDPPVQILVGSKKPNEPKRFSAKAITLNEAKLRFLSEAAKYLNIFSTKNWDDLVAQTQKIYKGSRTSLLEFDFVQKSISRQLRSVFEKLEPLKDISWYHRVKNVEGRWLTAPMKLNKNYDKLEISVQNQEGVFSLKIEFCISAFKSIDIQEMRHFACLLAHKSDYFILKPTDLALVNKILTLDFDANAHNAEDFMKYIVVPIEETHKVDRNNCFHAEVIDMKPSKMVHLSEISGQFLMLTPRFNYDITTLDSLYKEAHEMTVDGVLYQIKRDKETEENFRKYIKDLHPNFSKQFNESYFLSFADAKKKNWFLKVYHQLLEDDVAISGMDMLQHFRYSPHPIETKITPVKTEGNLLTVKAEVKFGKEKVDPKELKKNLLSGSRAVLLKDNSIGALTEEWVEQYGMIFKHGKILYDEIQIPKWLLLTDHENQKTKKWSISESWWQKWKHWQTNDNQLYKVPAMVNATLRPYQQKGFEWMVLLSEINAGACLADDMGLGKTMQTISFMAYQFEQVKSAKFLVVCPASLIFNWKKEIETFAPDLKTHVYQGGDRNFDDFINSDEDVLVCSYATARNDVDILRRISWNLMVLDESHNIKNLNALTTRAIHQIIANNYVVLSGTPIINNTFDLYAQFELILPGLLGSQEFFRNEYAKPIDRLKNPLKIQALNKLTSPFILRRTKQQVAKDLPDKVENILYCQMEEAQQEAYDTIKKQITDSVFLNIQKDGLNKSKLSILQGMLKLRQVCSAPSLLKNEDFGHASSVKIDMLMDELSNNLRDHKVLVFSQFTTMLHLIADQLKSKNIPYLHFDGSTPAEKRMDMVNQFQKEDSKERVFLISLKAGNTGITLTQADYVFLVDPWWNEAVQRQAIDRTHRIGQTKTVFAYKMICKNTIEEKMLALQQRKQYISDELIIEDENIVKNLTEEDIEFLFG